MTSWSLAIVQTHIESLTVGIIKQNLMMKKQNIDKPSQKLKCIAMTRPKKAAPKCNAKYKAINKAFIFLHSLGWLLFAIDCHFCLARHLYPNRKNNGHH